MHIRGCWDLQGIVGTTPWNAMVFFTLWLQLLGFSDFTSSALMAIFAFGCAVGAFAGGLVGRTPDCAVVIQIVALSSPWMLRPLCTWPDP